VPVNEDRIKEIKDKGDKIGGYMKKIDWNSPYGGALAGVIALVVIFLFFIGFMWLCGTYPIVGLVLFGILVLLFVGIWLFEKWFELKRLQSEYLRNQSLRGKMRHKTYIGTGNSDNLLEIEWYSGFKSETVSFSVSEYCAEKKVIQKGSRNDVSATAVRLEDLKQIIAMIEEQGKVEENIPDYANYPATGYPSEEETVPDKDGRVMIKSVMYETKIYTCSACKKQFKDRAIKVWCDSIKCPICAKIEFEKDTSMASGKQKKC
jgi:hypothetical protein